MSWLKRLVKTGSNIELEEDEEVINNCRELQRAKIEQWL